MPTPQSAMASLMMEHRTEHVLDVKLAAKSSNLHPNRVSQRIYGIRDFIFAVYRDQPAAVATQLALWIAEAEMAKQRWEAEASRKRPA